ncbi:MAG TPA: hypothetical protein VKU90_13605 [Caulobacteraceae bacterium]|jgi:hypothetical protein|nr:hypothetical protein [Caulobacteraceae bacterium]
MRKILTTGLAALALAGTAVGGATPATAQSFHHGFRGDFRGFRGRGFDRDDGGIALAAGVIGLGLGAAIASDHNYYYGPGPYYGDPYGYPGYAVCYGRQRVWDPYVGAYVIERVRYAC